jgi:hypothetical protein
MDRAIVLGIGVLAMLVGCGSGEDVPKPAGEAGGSSGGGQGGTAAGGALASTASLGGAAGAGGFTPDAGFIDGGFIAPSPAEWVQEAHDAERTGYTPTEPAKPWVFKWFWASPVAVQEATMARGVHPVTGGNFVYMPAGSQGLFALKKTDGTVGWQKTQTAYDGAGAYDGSSLFVGGENGKLYKYDAVTGNENGAYDAGSAIKHAVLLEGGYLYVTTDEGKLHKVDKTTMAAAWTSPYDAGSPATTPPTYSASRDVVVFGTADLYVHAVVNATGAAKWKKNPTPFTTASCTPYSYEYVWPVVADGPGVVFIRLRLGDQNGWLWGAGGPNGRYPTTNADIRTYLDAHPDVQALHALSLDDGTKKFTPAVGNGGVDAFFQDCSSAWVFRSTVGPMPAVRTLAGGKQVAYVIWRNGLVKDDTWDARWDSHLGEMVLDGNTVPGYAAGDLRFIQADGSFSTITDEACPITFAGSTMFYAHWGGSESYSLTDRSDGKGDTYANPITSTANHVVSRRVQPVGPKNTATRWIDTGANWFGDSRGYFGGIWWAYWNEWDPPTTNSYQDNHYPNRPRYTIVSDGMVIVVGNGGDLFVLSHG